MTLHELVSRICQDRCYEKVQKQNLQRLPTISIHQTLILQVIYIYSK